MPILSFKLGALAVLSTVGTLWHQYQGNTPTDQLADMVPSRSIFECAVQHGGCPKRTAQAKEWLQSLQAGETDAAIDSILDVKSPIHQMLRSLPSSSLSDFEDCGSLRPGVGTTLLAQDSIKKSAYRTFLRSSMKCAGAAFQASGEVFPSEGMAMDVLEMMSVDWLASTMLTMELAGKYKPAISALPNNGNRIFQECMAKLEKVPGSPAASNKIKSPRRRMEAEQNSVGFTDVVADVAGINELPKPPARSGVEGGVPQKGGPNRRLMKGFFFFFFFNTFGDASYSGSCFGDDGIVTNALTQQPMQMRDVGLHDRLVTTVPDDEVWFMHSSSKPTDTTRLVTSTGSAIELTPAHMIMTSTGMKQAGEVQVGDSLVKQTGELSEVVRKEAGKVSVTAPITMSGTIVVDGVVASCYAYGNHQVMHTALAPFRLLYSLSPEMAMFIAQSGLAVMSAMPESVLANHMSQVLVASVLFALALPVSAAYLTGSKALRRGQAVTA